MPDTTTPPPDQYAIRVIVPTDTPSGPGADPIEHRVGPIDTHAAAARLAWVYSTQYVDLAVPGTQWDVVPYDSTITHADPYPTLDVDQLADLIHEDTGPGGEYGAPGVYDRLVAAYGRQGHAAYQQAAHLLDQREAQSDAARAARVAPYRDLIRRRAGSTVSLITDPIIEQAGELLADIVRAGERHGVTLDDWAGATSQPAACLDVLTRRWYGDASVSRQKCVDLLDVFRARLDEAGYPSTLRAENYCVELRDAPPGERWPLRLLIDSQGWSVQRAVPHLTFGLAAYVFAPPDERGARAVADAVGEIMRGERSMPGGLT